MTKPTPEVLGHYLKLTVDTVEALLQKVFAANGLPEKPEFGRELALVPVYEDGYKETLLTLANIRAVTEISCPVTSKLDYLQAYYKRYRGPDGLMRNSIVVLASNYCWARFYAAKELFHCFLDDDGIAASNSIPLVNDLIGGLAAGGFARPHDCDLQTAVDEIAYLGALQYLIPTAWLPTLTKLEQELSAEFKDGNAMLYLAQLLRVPEVVLRYRMQHYKPRER